MKHKAQIIIVAIVSFIVGFFTPGVFLKSHYEQSPARLKKHAVQAKQYKGNGI